MANFTGTIKEFEKYIGPRLRNVVQTSIARKLRNDIGRCEICKSKKDLQAAHLSGLDRKTLIKKALGNDYEDDKIIEVNIDQFEQRFIEIHNPPEKIFKILCRQCHNDYDKVSGIITIEDQSDEQAPNINNEDTNNNQILPIEFFPEDILEFKELLLKHKRAIISIYYNGGNKEIKEWNASKITQKSDIIRNLRSRNEFRQGNWQESNIKLIKAEINDIDLD